MNAARRFKYHFTPKRLKELYNNKIIYRATVGMDRIIPTAFEKELDANIDIISRKVFSGAYTFTRYREILISKGRDKCPRVISIPTIRDKLALAAFHSVLRDTYNDIIEEPLLHTIIADIAAALSSGKYNSYVKVDITRFYSSINHDILLSKVKKKIHKKEILQFLKNAISTATVPEGVKLQKDLQNKKGVPEGLSISNILADIYLSELKACLQARYTIDYFRYVDDILILCDASDADLIKAEIMEILQKDYDLKAHEEKTVSGYHLHNIIHLGWFKRGCKPLGTVHFLHLISGEPIAGHATGTVSQIHLYVFVNSKVVIALPLIEDLLYKGRRWRFSYRLSTRLRCSFRYHPPLFSLYCAWDFVLSAVAANHLHRDTPQRCGVFRCIKFHIIQSFQS